MARNERPVRLLIRSIAETATQWRDAEFPPRARSLAAVCARIGYSPAVVNYAFDRIFATLDASAIEALICQELGTLDVLDGFVTHSNGKRIAAVPVGRVCVVSSRTTVGVALLPALFALCAKCTVTVKDREDALVATFFQTLAQTLPDLAQAATATSWDGTAGSGALKGFDAVVAFGGDQALFEISRSLDVGTRFIGFGAKASCGYAGRDALGDAGQARQIATAAARDVVLYDTQGCLSLHVLFVEGGGAVDVQTFSDLLSAAIERTATEFPIGRRDPVAVARLLQARRLADFRAAELRGGERSDAQLTHLVLVDPPRDEPPPFLPRAVAVLAVDAPADALDYIRSHRLMIEAVAVAGRRSDIVAMSVAAGAARIAPFGTLQAPPLDGYHGGRPRIAEFVRWVTDET